jgi:branched-chain amino acid transport system ATP-binding protein
MSEAILSIDDIDVRYGHVEALGGVSLDLILGETHALLGPNGAGKSTLLKTISGLLAPSRGRIVFQGKDIHGRRADRITALGIVQVPEGRQIIAPLTVQENLQLAHQVTRGPVKRMAAELMATVYDAFPILAEFRNKPGGLLSGGQQQMLAIGRAIMTRPQVLLLDEPSMGLAPVMVEKIYEFLGMKEQYFGDCTVLLAEQSQIALSVADRVTLVAKGKTVHTSLAADMDESVALAAYFGTQETNERDRQ